MQGDILSVVRSNRMSLRRRIGGAAAAVALSVVAVFSAAGPASAAISDCPSGQTCVWKDDNYASGGWGFYYRGYNNGINNFSKYTFGGTQGTVDLNVTSIYNNGNQQRTILFTKYYFADFLIDFPIKRGSANLGFANDKARSGGFQFCYDNPYSHVCT